MKTPAPASVERATARTVRDFGDQWTRYTENEGWYASLDLFRDVFGTLLVPEQLAGCRVADIGSGTGRIVQMLIAAGAAHVTALEPSAAFSVLEENTRQFGDRVRCLHVLGEELPADDFDYVVSYGVLHHIPDPRPVVDAAFRALRPGGAVAVWLYGREGNELYLAAIAPMRALTTRLPHVLLVAISWPLTLALSTYAAACRVLPLPLRAYMRRVIANLSLRQRYLNVYDQLNPAHAKYYRRHEAEALLTSAGFVDVQLYHRHGYSWSVVGRKP